MNPQPNCYIKAAKLEFDLSASMAIAKTTAIGVKRCKAAKQAIITVIEDMPNDFKELGFEFGLAEMEPRYLNIAKDFKPVKELKLQLLLLFVTYPSSSFAWTLNQNCSSYFALAHIMSYIQQEHDA